MAAGYSQPVPRLTAGARNLSPGPVSPAPRMCQVPRACRAAPVCDRAGLRSRSRHPCGPRCILRSRWCSVAIMASRSASAVARLGGCASAARRAAIEELPDQFHRLGTHRVAAAAGTAEEAALARRRRPRAGPASRTRRTASSDGPTPSSSSSFHKNAPSSAGDGRSSQRPQRADEHAEQLRHRLSLEGDVVHDLEHR